MEILLFAGVFMVSLLPIILGVEWLLRRFLPFKPVSVGRILGRSIIRWFAYSPAVIGAGHGAVILAAPVACAFIPIAENVMFGFGLPEVFVTLLVFSFSVMGWQREYLSNAPVPQWARMVGGLLGLILITFGIIVLAAMRPLLAATVVMGIVSIGAGLDLLRSAITGWWPLALNLPLLLLELWTIPFVRLGVWLTLIHFALLVVLWAGHGSLLPKGMTRILLLGGLPAYLASPVFGFGLAFVYLKLKRRSLERG
jgi:hypothetical protein